MRQCGLDLAEQLLVILLRPVFSHVRLSLRTRLHPLHKLLFRNRLKMFMISNNKLCLDGHVNTGLKQSRVEFLFQFSFNEILNPRKRYLFVVADPRGCPPFGPRCFHFHAVFSKPFAK